MEEIADTGLCIDREAIRANLSQMSFEELQKMKEEFGAKVYNETVHGTTSKKRRLEQTEYKRANKNRPREMSAKRPVRIVNEMTTVKIHIPRDPSIIPSLSCNIEPSPSNSSSIAAPSGFLPSVLHTVALLAVFLPTLPYRIASCTGARIPATCPAGLI
ncbi:uncharacterized protein CBL_12113 [Carabus blaptoides fortunei]